MASKTNPEADAALMSGRSYRRGLSLGLGLSELLVLFLFLLLLLSVPYATTRPAAEAPPDAAAQMQPGETPKAQPADTPKTPPGDAPQARPGAQPGAPPAASDDSAALLAASRQELARAQAENAALRKNLSRDKQELLDQLEQQTLAIAHLTKEKGLDASCWYDFDDAGKQNQVYLFDVNVYDVGVEIEALEAPPQYAREKALLPLDLPYGERLSDRDFLRATQPVYEHARTRKLRPYPCVFYVRVRDRTSVASPQRYKQADERVVGKHFYRYHSRTP